jgi:molybdopterin-containing oxidoreductase family membrane subunit
MVQFVLNGFILVSIFSIVFGRRIKLRKQALIYRSSALYIFSFCIAFDFFTTVTPALIERITSFFNGNDYENYILFYHASGPYVWTHWLMAISSIIGLIFSQLLWSSKYHTKNWIIIWSVLLSLGPVYLERWIIILSSLHRDFLVSNWAFIPLKEWITGQIISVTLFFICLLILEYIRNYFKTKNDLPNKA